MLAYRGMVADFLEERADMEAALPPAERLWTPAIVALQGQGDMPPAATAAAVRAHIRGVRTDRPLTNIELGVLVEQLQHLNVLITEYNPTYTAASGFCSVLGGADPATATHVRIAHVPAGGVGELNHWNAVLPRDGQLGPMPSGTPAGKGVRRAGDDALGASVKKPRTGDL